MTTRSLQVSAQPAGNRYLYSSVRAGCLDFSAGVPQRVHQMMPMTISTSPQTATFNKV